MTQAAKIRGTGLATTGSIGAGVASRPAGKRLICAKERFQVLNGEFRTTRETRTFYTSSKLQMENDEATSSNSNQNKEIMDKANTVLSKSGELDELVDELTTSVVSVESDSDSELVKKVGAMDRKKEGISN